jgi:hypothetical protein
MPYPQGGVAGSKPVSLSKEKRSYSFNQRFRRSLSKVFRRRRKAIAR